MKPDAQVAALRRGDCSFDEWSQAWPVAGQAVERLAVLAQLDHDEQLDALRDERFSLSEWCAFARRDPHRCVRIGDEFAFIVVTTPEWCTTRSRAGSLDRRSRVAAGVAASGRPQAPRPPAEQPTILHRTSWANGTPNFRRRCVT